MDKLVENGFAEFFRNEKLEYYRNWRKNNKDKVRKHNQTYWQKRVQKKLEEISK